MTRSDRHVRILALLAACLPCGAWGTAARADGPKLTASFGIAGRYRLGGWCPVHVAVQNPSGDSLAGQIQIREDASPNGQSQPTGALFARPVSVPGGASAYQVCARGLDRSRDNLTVHLVEGRARGDGRALAQINTLDPATAAAFSGTPMTPEDLFLVGFGGDPAAFTFLGGQRLGLAHTPGGPVPDPAPAPPTKPNGNFTRAGNQGTGPLAAAQVAEAAAGDLPDRMAAYGGVDAVLLRSDAPLDALTVAQADALKGWVAGGGHLIVCGGADPSRLATPFFEGLLPAAVGPARTTTLPGGPAVPALALTPKPLPGVCVLLSSPGAGPLVVGGPYGAGSVTLTAYDPTVAALQASPASVHAFWRMLLSGRSAPPSFLSHVAAREEDYGGGVYYNGDVPALLSTAVMRGPSLDAPGIEVIGLFLLTYLIILVPVNYLVLKRLDRKELAWATIPALVVLFAAGTFGVGYAAKGGSLFLNRAAIVETAAGQRGAGVYSEIGLFSPRRTEYDISVGGGDVLAAIPKPSLDGSNRFGGGGDAQDYGVTRFAQTPAGASLLGASVNMWAMRAFDVQSTTDLGGTIDARLTPGAGGHTLAGTITNRTGHALSGCRLLYGDHFGDLGTLAPGASFPVAGALSSIMNQSAGQGLPLSHEGNPPQDDAGAPVAARMRAALSGYAQSLTRPPDNDYGNGTQARMPPYAPAPGEALLIGWSDDPALAGPAPRVDGQAVKENDVSLVIVHLPVSGA